MNNSYDEKLKEIDFYENHPEYRPFVGDNYSKYKILQVGESHYLPQSKKKADVVFIDYFVNNWWENPCNELKKMTDENSGNAEWVKWLNTRGVVKSYMEGYRTKGRSIFTNFLKACWEAYTGEKINKITTEHSKKYDHFAFINFFQMPSLYSGESFWKSLYFSAKRQKEKKKDAKQLANDTWDNVVKKSSDIFDKVVEILEPNVIVFTTLSAWNAYDGKYKNDDRIIGTVHPCCPYWHKPKNGQIGKEELIDKLKKLKKD